MIMRLFWIGVSSLSLMAVPALSQVSGPNEPDHGFTIRSSSNCEKLNGQSDHNRQVLLVLDRTTVLDAKIKTANSLALGGPIHARWNEGVDRIITSGDVIGDLRVLEIRESAVGMRTLGSGCLDRFTMDDPAASGSFAQRTGNELWRKATSWVAGSNQDEEKGRIVAAQHERKQLGNALKQIALADDPTRSDSEIALALVEQIQSNCKQRRMCQIFLFSDLLDSKAKLSLRNSREAAVNLGRSRADSLLREYAVGGRRTTLQVTVWGFGRDDIRPNAELPDQQRAALRDYWIGFLQTLNAKFAPDSGCVVSDSFPSNTQSEGCR